MRNAHSCFAVAICWLILAPAAGAQAPQSTSVPTFKSRADLVLVPVIVRDKHGNHVPGLGVSNFVLQQDGSVQRIASVEEIKSSRTALAAPVTTPAGTFTNQSASPQHPQELIIFAIDLVNTPILDVETARKAVLKFLSTQLKPNQMVGLVTINRDQVSLLHAFTTSPAVLSAALQKVTGVITMPELPEDVAVSATAARLARFAKLNEQEALQIHELNQLRRGYGIQTALDSLREIAYWVGGIPGRKVLIWATGDIPFNVSMSPDSKPGKSGFLYFENYQSTMRTLADNNIALYPVDVRGLLGPDFEKPGWGLGLSLGPPPDPWTAGIPARSAALQSGVSHIPNSHAAMNIMAEATGGRAFYNRNDIPKLFQNAVEDSSAYYMLSYYLDPKQTQPGWHKLKVSVGEKGLTVRARSGLFIGTSASSAAQRDADEQTALVSPFEYTALPISFQWKPAANGNGKMQFEVTIPPDAGLIDSEHPALDVDVLAVATGGNAEVAGRYSRNVRTTLSPASVQRIEANGITYLGDLEVKPGEYAVRLVVRDNLTGRLGSVTAPLKVQP